MTDGTFSFFVGGKGFGLDMPVELVADTTLSPNLIWASNSGDGGVTRIIDDGKTKDDGDDGDKNAQPDNFGRSKLKGTHIPGGGQDNQGGITLDNCGNVWVANGTGSVTKIFNFSSENIHHEGVWHGNRPHNTLGPIAVGGITPSSDPFGITTDSANHVWVLNQSGNSVTELDSSGKALSPADGFKASDVIVGPYSGIAIDRTGNVWIANAGNNSITEFVGSAAPVATPRTQGRPISPDAAAATSSSTAAQNGTKPPDGGGCQNPCDGKNKGDGDDDNGGCHGDN